ncbi:LacI family DNA-binding transcriptional regulator [Acaricomes phytoseiuli]|uniref:LacI family DNA-binding transcriptional regulator n=1 Tax=Acaricomes phytoseiuli TaxID=291968 RepID=UPI00068660D3|nr:LacI family DNA-binding transcriptional regulator [Acaricomes phytoseiuli]
MIAASIDDVAAAVKVSTATVSRAIRGLPRVNPQTRERVLAAAAELGYVASSSASGLATGRTKTLGVLSPYISRWFFVRTTEGIDEALRDQGYSLMLINLGDYRGSRERLFEHTMLRKQIDALVVLCLDLNTSELEHLHRTEIPLMALGGPVEGVHKVGIDDYQAARRAVDHLLELGHREIAILGGDGQDHRDFAVPRLRSAAYLDALKSAGVPVRPEWQLRGGFTVTGGQRAASQLFDAAAPRPTAIFCASDEMALGVIWEARSRGISVPEELSVIGIDDHDFSAAAGLTTIRQDPLAQGRQAAELLLSHLQDETPLRSIQAPIELVLRSSTAKPSSGISCPAAG